MRFLLPLLLCACAAEPTAFVLPAYAQAPTAAPTLCGVLDKTNCDERCGGSQYVKGCKSCGGWISLCQQCDCTPCEDRGMICCHYSWGFNAQMKTECNNQLTCDAVHGTVKDSEECSK